MRLENEEQELGWAPKRYPTYSAFERGEWRTVTENGEPVAFVWSNGGRGAGIKWVTQTNTVVDIHKMFLNGAMSDIPPAAVYGAVESKFSTALGDPNHTPLGDADEFLNMLNED